MDKSEGRSFFSKTFSSVSETVAKWYHTGNMKMSISSLKRARNEKLQALGNKIYELIAAGKAISTDALKTEYKSIVDLDAQIVIAEKDLEKLQEAAPETADKTAAAKKPARAVRKPATKKAAAKKPAAKKVGADKPAAEKADAKKPAARKTRAAKSVPAVKTKATPAVRKKAAPAVKKEEKPAVRKEATPAVRPETEVSLKKNEV